MAQDCFCLKITVYCLDETSFDIYMNVVGSVDGRGFYVGEYDGQTYCLRYSTLGLWYFQNINNPSSIFVNNNDAQVPCSLPPNDWQVNDISNFNYCGGDFDSPPIVITNLTDDGDPNCDNTFTGECSCQEIIINDKCTIFAKTCDGNIYQQVLLGAHTIVGCFIGTPIIYPPSSGVITPYTESTCDNYCTTGDTCCLNVTASTEVSTLTFQVYPTGTFDNNPYFTFSAFTNYDINLYYDSENSTWGATSIINGQELVLFILETPFKCPSGSWTYVEGPIYELITEQVDCPLPSSTPTPTPTPTPTKTPTPPSPPIPNCLQGTNECNVITLFQMGVECQVTHPTNIDAPDGSATLIITGGTPPYSVFWDNNNIGSSIYNLSPGSYNAIITDYYGDFTANTTCVLTGETPTPSQTPTPTPTTPFVGYPLCVTTILEGNPVSSTFSYNGFVGGKPSWTNGSKTIEWSGSTNQWVLYPSPSGSVVINNNPSTPPLTGWQILGFPGTPTIQVSQGECQDFPVGNPLMRQLDEIQPLSIKYSKNEPICGCEGTISLIGYGGVTPYQYSINGGITYRNIPMFTNLCSGIYYITIMDSLGTIASDSVKLNVPSNPTTYVVSLTTSSITTINNGTVLSKTYTTKVNVTPSLSDGVVLTFDVSHTNSFRTSPGSDSSTNINNSTLYKNSSPIDVSYSSTTTGSTFNTKAGCQSSTVGILSTTNNWQTIQMSNSDEIIITTISTVTQNESNPCYVGNSDESYSVTNLKLSGCGCCNAISG